MNKSFWRLVLVVGTSVILTGCGNKETKEALQKAAGLEDQKQYHDANDILVQALQAREAKLRADAGLPADQPVTDQATSDALTKKVQADPEILKMERAQIPIYLHMERADMASAVYTDILTGNPGDTVVYDLLHDKDAAIRAGAVHILGLSGKADAIDALTGATKDPDQEVRRAAVAALGSICDPKAVPPLIDALKDPYWFARWRRPTRSSRSTTARGQTAARSRDRPGQNGAKFGGDGALFLSKDKQAAVHPDDFASRLNDPQPKVVLISAVCLAVMSYPRSIPVLLKPITSTDQTTRLDAVKGLGETGDPSVIPTLRQTLKDPDVNMRGWSIIGLGSLKDEGSLDDLHAMADDPAEPSSIRRRRKRRLRTSLPRTRPPAGSSAHCKSSGSGPALPLFD